MPENKQLTGRIYLVKDEDTFQVIEQRANQKTRVKHDFKAVIT